MSSRREIPRTVAVVPRVRDAVCDSAGRSSPLLPTGVLLLSFLFSTAVSAADAKVASNAPGAVGLDSDPHLVGWWKFDEASGKRAADSSKHSHDGTLEGSLSFDTHSAPGRSGKAVRLEGNNDCIRMAGFKGVIGTQPRTVAAWIKTPAGEGDLTTWGTNDHGQMWIFGHIRGRIGVTPKGGYLYMKAGTDDDAWHHVAVVVREASPPNLHDDVKLFRDGELAEIDDIGLLDLWPIETGDQQDVCVGRRFKGLIDDLRIYDRALSEDEVKALFKLEGDRPLPKAK
jgi:hypothetical protein